MEVCGMGINKDSFVTKAAGFVVEGKNPKSFFYDDGTYGCLEVEEMGAYEFNYYSPDDEYLVEFERVITSNTFSSNAVVLFVKDGDSNKLLAIRDMDSGKGLLYENLFDVKPTAVECILNVTDAEHTEEYYDYLKTLGEF